MSGAEENAYSILGLSQGPETTENDIKKAYRKLALIKHPDKNPNNPNAADEFAVLQKAYDILTDIDARKALDEFLRARAARAERTAIHDKKRQRMAEDLIRREKAAEALSEEAQAKARLQSEIARLRKAAAEQQKSKASHHPNAAESAEKQQKKQEQQQNNIIYDNSNTAVNGKSDRVSDALPRTLKVTWSLPSPIIYDTSKLKSIFSVHGPVEEVIKREDKKNKGSALVVMATVDGVDKAIGSVHGDMKNPLFVVPLQTKATTRPTGKYDSEYVQEILQTDKKDSHDARNSGRSLGLGPRPAAPLFPAATQQLLLERKDGVRAAAAAAVQFSSFNSFQVGHQSETSRGVVEDDPALLRKAQGGGQAAVDRS